MVVPTAIQQPELAVQIWRSRIICFPNAPTALIGCHRISHRRRAQLVVQNRLHANDLVAGVYEYCATAGVRSGRRWIGRTATTGSMEDKRHRITETVLRTWQRRVT